MLNSAIGCIGIAHMDDFRDNAGCFINLNVGTIFHKKYKIILTLIGGSHILGIFRIIEQLQYIDRGDGSDRGEPALMQPHVLCIMIYPVINQQRGCIYINLSSSDPSTVPDFDQTLPPARLTLNRAPYTIVRFADAGAPAA